MRQPCPPLTQAAKDPIGKPLCYQTQQYTIPNATPSMPIQCNDSDRIQVLDLDHISISLERLVAGNQLEVLNTLGTS